MTDELLPTSLELKPLIIKSVNENGECIVTHVESDSLDLHSLSVNKYNYNLSLLGRSGATTRVTAAITESNANILSLAILNPTDVYFLANEQSFPFSNINQDFGPNITKTFRRYCEVIATTEAQYDANSNFTGLSSPFIEIAFKNLPEDTVNFGENLKLNQVTTALVNGKLKLTSISGRTFDGIDISLATTNGLINLSVGNSFWIEYVTRNEGLVFTPKVTGLTAPVDGSDAVNLDFLNQKLTDVSGLILNQDSFIATTDTRWVGTRALIFDNDGETVTTPDMLILGDRSTVMGIALTNPPIDETGLTEEQINLSYQRRVFTSGIVRDVVDAWNTPKGNVYAGPNGTLLETPPTSGRIIKIGQKYGDRDLLVSIQDYGFIYGISTVSRSFNFGPLLPGQRPPEIE